MTFLHLSLLAGAGLIVAPIVMHLIMKRQPRLVEFPALRFIQARKDSNRRNLRLRQLLLLLLRIGVIACLALALARPSIVASGAIGGQEAPVAAALLFDTSPRMLYRHHNETRLDAAREVGLWLLEQLPAESDVAVIDSATDTAAFAVNMGAARDRVKKLAENTNAHPLLRGLEEALRLLKASDKARKEIYIFTDLTRAAWAHPNVAIKQRLAESLGIGCYVIDVGVDDPQNFSLGDLRLNGQTLSKNTPLIVETDVSCQGAGGERVVDLVLIEDGKEIQRGQQNVTLDAYGSQRIEFRLGALSAGVHQGAVKLVGEDGLGADNVRHFTVVVEPPWRVLLAAPPKAADYALFLSEAIAPYALRVKGEAAFQCDVTSLDELPRKPLDVYAAVCLLDPTPLPASVWGQLGAYAGGGGGVALFLGRNAGSAAGFNAPAALELLPAQLVRLWKAGGVDVYLAPENLEHPLLRKFRPLETSVPWDGFPIYTHWQVGALADGATVVIPYSNGLPALLDKPLGDGRVLMMTTPVSDAANRRDLWNTLPTGDEPWPFVMLANEMLRYLVGSSATKLNYNVGETAMVPLPRAQQLPIALLRTPAGETIRQTIDERLRALLVTSTDDIGAYRARAGGEAQGVDLGFSVNLPSETTSLQRAGEVELKSVFGDAPFRLAHNQAEIDRSMSAARVGQELYPFLIVLVALILGGELVLANRFYRRDFRVESARAAKTGVAASIASTKQEVATARA
jgi:hypothetical protein